MSMIEAKARISMFSLAAVLLIASPASAPAGSSETEFKAAYAAAEAVDREARRLRNQWTVTAAALAAAKRAAGKADFDQAISSAKEAEALAKASIFQAASEKEAWKQLEIR